MASTRTGHFLLFALLVVILFATPAAAFGAGNIASIARVEGKNWRHGDIEDVLKTVAFLRGHKWTSLMVKRAYFGNWLRDYSQAIDVGSLKGVQADAIRILVWVLAFMSFGYATGEFEVTSERLGVYRPEEHIDNPKDYADNQDARQLDPRLRAPVAPQELAVDHNTGMKNYIANEHGGWATSSGYVKHSLARSIHFGRVYTSGERGTRGREGDLCEALRCLGQALHCLEDFAAHSNYVELVLRELGFHGVFPHTGTATQINLRGKPVFPLVTGTFGAVDFLHSVLGEATDHFTQSEIDAMDSALSSAATQSSGSRASGSHGGSPHFVDMLSKVPGMSNLCQEAMSLQSASDAQAAANAGSSHRGLDDYSSTSRAVGDPSFAPPPGTVGGPPAPGIPGLSPRIDPQATIAKIYPILQFRDKVARAISTVVSKVPGLEALLDRISENVTVFIMSLLAPFVQPIIKAVSQQLKQGSSAVVDASGKHQYEPWTDPYCTDPTHSLLSKDHFSNILNEPAGQVAAATLKYVAPRIIYAWEHPDVPLQQVMDDIVRVFHHPAVRDPRSELHRNMFDAVERWLHASPSRGANINHILGSESVKAGHNHVMESSGGATSLQGYVAGLGPNVQNLQGRLSNALHFNFGGSGGGGGGSGHRDLSDLDVREAEEASRRSSEYNRQEYRYDPAGGIPGQSPYYQSQEGYGQRYDDFPRPYDDGYANTMTAPLSPMAPYQDQAPPGMSYPQQGQQQPAYGSTQSFGQYGPNEGSDQSSYRY